MERYRGQAQACVASLLVFNPLLDLLMQQGHFYCNTNENDKGQTPGMIFLGR